VVAPTGQLIGEINRNGAVASLVLCAFFGGYPFLFGKISYRQGLRRSDKKDEKNLVKYVYILLLKSHAVRDRTANL